MRFARGAGERSPSLRHRPFTRFVAVLGVAAVLAGSPAGGVPGGARRPATAVGHDLGHVAGPRMDPVMAPARIARVVAVPGSRNDEAWAFGHTHWRSDGYSQTDPQGQGVFLSYARGRGWRIEQPLLNAEGRPTSPGVSAFDMAAGGEGWGVGGTGLLFHRPAGGRWQVHSQSGVVANVDLTAVSLGRESAGVYGWATGAGPTFLRLRDGAWEHDLGSVRGTGGTGDLLGNIVSVAAIDRENAWAVAASPRQLILYRRTAAEGWQRVQTGKTLFDVAPSVQSSGGGAPVVNQYASGAAVTVAGDAVWVTGALQPVDGQRYVSQRGPGSDPQRPFALRIQGATFTSYCAPIYQLSSGGISSTNTICDEPFPFSVGSLPALDGLPTGEVFAGGAGVFRYRNGTWMRQPNVAGLVSSLSFGSATEGWVASYGNRTADGGGFAASTSPTLGHWTDGPAEPRWMRRWPHPSRNTLEAIALDPSGGRSALAVGGGGDIARVDPGAGWEMMRSPVTAALHDVAWPSARTAWAVGEKGAILRYDGASWRPDPASGRLTNQALYGLAFRGSGEGIAVGAKGTILRYDGAGWRADPRSGRVTTERLQAVAYAGASAIAVGEKTTILTDTGSGWIVDVAAPERFKTLQEGRTPNLFAVVGMPDGRAFIGGELSILLERPAGGGAFARTTSHPMLSGAVLALAAGPSGGLLASVASEPSGRVSKYGGSGLIEPTGWLYASDGRVWRAVGEQRVAETGTEIDAPVRRDAVYDIAVGGDGRGFAVGGYPADLPDEDGHLSSLPSGSIWRLDTAGQPEDAPNHTSVAVRAAPGSIGFAFVADTACVSGLCSAGSGMGSRADEILMRALADVEASAANGDVRFAAFGGDFRRLGIPDELAAVNRMLDSLSIPSFAAIGDQDLFGGLDAAGETLLASNGYYLSAFARRPAPWGHAPPGRGIVPVGAGDGADRDAARTHYAFDYGVGGRALVRMIFLDTSRAAQEVAFQNPPADQDTWLRPVIEQANALGIPSVVVMHQPMLASIGTGARTGTLTAALAGSGVTAVLASHERVNRIVEYADPVQPFPVAILGSTGAALKGSWKPEAGAYHAWMHVSVPVGGGRAVLRSIPVLESVAMSATRGRTAGAGSTLSFTGLARLPDTGGGHVSGGGDPSQDRAQYLSFPLKRPCAGALENPNNADCLARDAMPPDHEFACEDERVCVFVREDPARPGVPYRTASGTLETSTTSGLMCALDAGRTHVSLRVGTVRSRLPVTVAGGDGPCVRAAIADSISPGVVPAAEPRQAPVSAERDAPPPILKPKTFEIAAIPALAPPPIQPAPAPPGGGAPKYEEERESATEKAEMTALDPAFRRAASRAPSPVTGGLIGLALAVATLAIAGRRTPGPSAAAARIAFAGRPPDPRQCENLWRRRPVAHR